MPACPRIVLTGGPGSGKTTLMRELHAADSPTRRWLFVPEAAPGQVLLCHRGTLDPLAYWLRHRWAERDFFAYTETTQDEHFRRYGGVIHLQTAALGAEAHYRRWPDAHRPETVAQAAETDHLCAHAWRDHPRYVLIDNIGRNWPAKAQAARDLLQQWVEL